MDRETETEVQREDNAVVAKTNRAIKIDIDKLIHVFIILGKTRSLVFFFVFFFNGKMSRH